MDAQWNCKGVAEKSVEMQWHGEVRLRQAMALNGRAKQWLCMQGVVSTSEGNEQNRNELSSNGVAGKGAEEHSNGIAWG